VNLGSAKLKNELHYGGKGGIFPTIRQDYRVPGEREGGKRET